MDRNDRITKPCAFCVFCGKPWYGKVSYCPYCGKEAAKPPGKPEVHPIEPEEKIPLPKPTVKVEEETGKAFEDGRAVRKPERSLGSQEPSGPQGGGSPWDPDRWKRYAPFGIIIALGLAGLWYLKNPHDSGVPPIRAPDGNLTPDGSRPKKPVAGSPVGVQETPKPPSSKPEAVPSVVPQPVPPVSTIPAPSASPDTGEAPSVDDVLDLFPIAEASRYVNGMLAGAKNDSDAAIMSSRRLLQGVALPPHGKRKEARASNSSALEFVRTGDWKSAVRLLGNAARADPADQEIVTNLAYALYRAQRLQDARLTAIAALALAPERATAWANLGMILSDQGGTDSAVSAFMLSYRFSSNPQRTREFLQKLIQEEPSLAVRAAAERALSKISALPVAPPTSSVQPQARPSPNSVQSGDRELAQTQHYKNEKEKLLKSIIDSR